MQNSDGIIKTDKFTFMPSSQEQINSFLNAHLGDSLIEIIDIKYYQCDCKVRTADGDKVVKISLPAKYIHHDKTNH